MMVKKVNIEELVSLLLEMRKNTEFVDFQIEADNVLKVRKHHTELSTENDTPLTDEDLNQIIG